MEAHTVVKEIGLFRRGVTRWRLCGLVPPSRQRDFDAQIPQNILYCLNYEVNVA